MYYYNRECYNNIKHSTERLLNSLATLEDDEINEPEVDLKKQKGMEKKAGKKKHYTNNF